MSSLMGPDTQAEDTALMCPDSEAEDTALMWL